MEINCIEVSKSYILKDGIFKKRRIQVLEDINLDIKQGEIVAIISETSGGKSTLINLLSGGSIPDSGVVLVDGINDSKTLNKNCSVIKSLNNKLLINESVYNNLVYFGKKMNMSEFDIEKRIVDLKNVLDFEKNINSKVNQLNDISLAKANLAVYLMNSPSFIFVDDVLSRLNPINKMTILKDLRRVNKEFKTTIIVASGDISDVEKICKRVIFLNGGRIVIDDNFEAIKKEYLSHKIISITFNKSFNLPKGDFSIIENSEYFVMIELDFNKCDFATLINQFDINTIVDIEINSASIKSII